MTRQKIWGRCPKKDKEIIGGKIKKKMGSAKSRLGLLALVYLCTGFKFREICLKYY